MLKKINRITIAEFKRLGRPLRVFHSPLFSIRLYNTDSEKPKCAVVVSKKAAATAVARNLARRRFYEALYANLASMQAYTASVVMVTKGGVGASFAAIQKALSEVYGER